MGIGTIMRARRILVVASGEDKAQIVHDAFFGPVTPQVPASVLPAAPRRDGHRGREGGGAVRVGAPDERRAKLAPPPATNEHVRKSMQGNKRKEHQAGDARARSGCAPAGLTGYRLQWKVPGRPDIAWPGKRVALFIKVRGCFWHRHEGCPYATTPKSPRRVLGR